MSEMVEQLKQRAAQLRRLKYPTNDRINAINDTVWEMRYVNDPLVEHLCAEALQLAGQNGYERGRAYALHHRGWFNIFGGYGDVAEEGLQESCRIFLKLKDETGLASAFNGLAVAERKAGKHQAALENHLSALALRKKIGDAVGAAGVLTNIGIVYKFLGNYEAALDYYYDAVQVAATDSSETAGSTLVYHNLGEVLWRVGETAQAIKYLRRALNAHRKHSNELFESMALVNLGAAYSSRGEHRAALNYYQRSLAIGLSIHNFETQAGAELGLGIVHCKIGDNPNAVSHLSHALEFSRSINNRRYESETLLWLGLTHKQGGDAVQSVEMLESALQMGAEINANDVCCNAHLALSEAYQKQNKLAAALHHHQAFHRIWQDLFGTASSRRIGQLLLQFKETPSEKTKSSKFLRRDAKTSGAHAESVATLTPRKLQEVSRFITDHLEKNITVAELADSIGLSQNYFLRSFKRSTGKTPHQFLLEQRVARAAELLKKTALPLSEIALRCGFSNQSHLTVQFRLRNGMTPRAFRQSQI